MRKRLLLISTLYLLGLGYSQAQFRFSKNYSKGRKPQFEAYSSVGFGIGTSNYYGELAPITDPINATFKMMRWNITGNYTRHFTPRLSGRAALTLARLAGDDYTYSKGRPSFDGNFYRNAHFRNDLKELSLTGIYNIVPEGRNAFDRPVVVPYIFGGLALFAHNPKARTPEDLGNEWVRLQPLGTEGQGQPGGPKSYSLVSASIPVGLGFRFRYKRNWDISAEAGIRFTFTDYLDDVGGNYANPASFTDPIALAMSDRTLEPIAARKGGDRIAELQRIAQANNGELPSKITRGGGNKDMYLLTAIHVNYIITPKIKCPPLR
ncbi:hypothetical protein [Siphonobacter sp. BAB-5405]|uniref:DUF6089 family protein n=1 Tax=Siphonobacter sp. BAB-5405 TaxID=1864825 RepID=UPI0018EC14A0|nr:hypothetical protein [Siphonobacter sp. BAB-5405]